MRSLDLAPECAERVPAGQRTERVYGGSEPPNFYRKPYGDGSALIGDAGLPKDSFLALGFPAGCKTWNRD